MERTFQHKHVSSDKHHHHHHHQHNHNIEHLNTVYVVAVLLNVVFVVVEAVVGISSKSLGLLSDAGHNLSDVFSLLLAMVAFRLASSHATRRFTYGYRKSSVLISLLNALILLVAVGVIVVESIRKIAVPSTVDGAAVTWTAAVGILVNGVTAWMLARQQKHDINTRGAFLHMLSDTLVSLGVVVSGIVISHTGWTLVDPVVGLVIATVILVSTAKLLAESLRMSIDAIPENIDPDSIVEKMEATQEVVNVHHVHIWPISTTETALTAHVVISDSGKMELVTDRLKQLLDTEGIHHSTLELETHSSHCHDRSCCPQC